MGINVSIVRTAERKENLLPFLVDVPVKTNIWVRPECQKKQFEVIKKAKPSILFIQSDGGRNDDEWKKIYENRKLYEEQVDWCCTIHLIYANENSGMYTMGTFSRNYIWKNVDMCIVLEDDHIPSVSFFSFCKELLERYKDDLRINAICGNNYTGISEECTSDYLFSRKFAVWGYACWKRTYEMAKIPKEDDYYTINAVCNIAKKSKNFCSSIKGYAKGELPGGHIPGSEFFLNLNVFAQNQLFIFPKCNMISCWGATSGSTHAVDDIKKMPKGIAQLYYMKTYEQNSPIVHPDYVFPDLDFERKQDRITATNHPLLVKYRRAIGVIKRICYGDGVKMLKMFFYRIKEKPIEK